MNTKIIAMVAALVGLLFLYGAFLYATTPAQLLPHSVPGFAADVTKIHYKHAIGSFFLGLAAFAFAWFQLGPKSANPNKKAGQ